jgi:hypothetical protein
MHGIFDCIWMLSLKLHSEKFFSIIPEKESKLSFETSFFFIIMNFIVLSIAILLVHDYLYIGEIKISKFIY